MSACSYFIGGAACHAYDCGDLSLPTCWGLDSPVRDTPGASVEDVSREDSYREDPPSKWQHLPMGSSDAKSSKERAYVLIHLLRHFLSECVHPCHPCLTGDSSFFGLPT